MKNFFFLTPQKQVHQLSRLVVLVLAVCVAFTGLNATTSLAQSTAVGGVPAKPDPKKPRTKSIFIKKISAGSSAVDAVKIVNSSSKSKLIQVYATDSAPSSGGAFACAQKIDSSVSVGSWITLRTKQLTVPANSSKIIPFTIIVPKSAEPGEKNGCIIIQESKSQSVKSGIGLSFRTGVRVAVLVAGDIFKSVDLLGISTSQTTDTIILTPRVKNVGNVSVDATVITTLKNVFKRDGEQQKDTYPLLREQDTTWNIQMKRPYWGGLYHASYSLSYDTSNNFIGDDANPVSIKTVPGQTKLLFIMPRPLPLFLELSLLVIIAGSVIVILRRYQHKKTVQRTWTQHTVKSNEQIQIIAKNHGISWRYLAKCNNIKPPYILTTGQTIKVPKNDTIIKPKSS